MSGASTPLTRRQVLAIQAQNRHCAKPCSCRLVRKENMTARGIASDQAADRSNGAMGEHGKH